MTTKQQSVKSDTDCPSLMVNSLGNAGRGFATCQTTTSMLVKTAAIDVNTASITLKNTTNMGAADITCRADSRRAFASAATSSILMDNKGNFYYLDHASGSMPQLKTSFDPTLAAWQPIGLAYAGGNTWAMSAIDPVKKQQWIVSLVVQNGVVSEGTVSRVLTNDFIMLNFRVGAGTGVYYGLAYSADEGLVMMITLGRQYIAPNAGVDILDSFFGPSA